jgi:hypothetical protein
MRKETHSQSVEMKTKTLLKFLIVICLTLTVFGCNLGSSPTQTPTENATVQDPGAITATPAVATASAPTPTSTTSAPVDAELSEAEILQIVQSSLSAFPWRLNQSVVVKTTGQTSTTLTEAQSSTRGYNKSVQPLGAETFSIETIMIDPLIWVKMTGSPSETYGLVDGQWVQVPGDSPLMQLVDMGTIDPARIAANFATDFRSMPTDGGTNELVFRFVGSETLSNGVVTNIYESKGAAYTYRWWIGADGWFHKTTVDLTEATRTILIEYDAGINIQPPIP